MSSARHSSRMASTRSILPTAGPSSTLDGPVAPGAAAAAASRRARHASCLTFADVQTAVRCSADRASSGMKK
eukprot:4158018-Prymnesium_polylepis.1